MRSFRIVILSIFVGAILLAFSVPFLRNADAIAIFSAVLVLEMILDFISCIYIGVLFYLDDERPRSWLLLLLLTTSTLSTLSVSSIGILVLLRISGNPPLPDQWGLLITGMGIILGGAAPLAKAATFLLISKSRRETAARPIQNKLANGSDQGQ